MGLGHDGGAAMRSFRVSQAADLGLGAAGDGVGARESWAR